MSFCNKTAPVAKLLALVDNLKGSLSYSQDWGCSKGLFQHLKSILLLNTSIPDTILLGQVREWL